MIFLFQGSLVWDGQTLSTMFAIIATAIFGSYAFGNTVRQAVNDFKDQYHRDQREFLEQWIPVREAIRDRRRVALVNATEPFVDHNPPVFSPEERALQQELHDNPDNFLDPKRTEDIETLIQAWDRHKNYPDPAVQQAAREIVAELNSLLTEHITRKSVKQRPWQWWRN